MLTLASIVDPCARCNGRGIVHCAPCGEAPRRACTGCHGTGRASCECATGTAYRTQWSSLLRLVATAQDRQLDALVASIGGDAVGRAAQLLRQLADRYDSTPLHKLLARRAHPPEPGGWRRNAGAIVRGLAPERLTEVAHGLRLETDTVVSIVQKPSVEETPATLRIALALAMGLHGAHTAVSLAWARGSASSDAPFDRASIFVDKAVDGAGAWRASTVLFEREDLATAGQIRVIGSEARCAGEDESIAWIATLLDASSAASL